MNLLKLLLIILISTNIYAIDIDDKTSNIDILSQSYIFIDETNTLSKNEVLEKKFIKNTKSTLGLGFVPNKALWIRFTLKNSSNKTIKKTLEFDSRTTEDILFFNGDKTIVEGMWHIDTNRVTLSPSFKITLNPDVEKTFYLKAHSNISTLIAKLTLWKNDDFIKKDYEDKTYLFVFFSILSTLLIYNFMLLIFTKDKAYMYYILYLGSVIFFQLNYLGIAQLYLFSNALSIFVAKGSMIYISLLIITIILFTREFLNTYQFKKIDILLKGSLYITPIIALLSYDNFIFNLSIIGIFIPLGIFVVYIGFYALYRGIKEAKFYVLGWSIVIISLIFTNLRTIGLFDITKYFSYMNELSFVLEALLFSIALAHRINILNEQKSISDNKLINFQKQEQIRLEKLVKAKTKDLTESLLEKDILYKELNHRVKNNLAMILSLIKLQISKTKIVQTKKALQITKNRINSISNLYESLHIQNNTVNVDTLTYIKDIEQNIQINFDKDIKVIYNIKYNLHIESLIYCGLIINELITNSFKYAFKDSGEINISLTKSDKKVSLVIEDNGIGFVKNTNDTLGLIIVQTLVQKQLFGKFHIDSDKGTKITIEWEEDE